MTRAEILAIFEQLRELWKLQLTTDWLRELIDQSANKPGLAVTLADLLRVGDWQEVRDGSALRRTLTQGFSKDPSELLAALSLGGDRGMSLAKVQNHLGASLIEIRQMAVELAAAGILVDLGEDHLAVWPRPLRWQLVNSVFFESPVRLRYKPLLAEVQSREDAIMTLGLSKARCGGGVDLVELKELVRNEVGRGPWVVLAQLGEDAARWVLENYRGRISDVLGAALQAAAPFTIAKILQATEQMGDQRQSSSDPWHILASWVTEAEGQDAVERRRQLAAEGCTIAAASPSVAARAIFLALSPEVSRRSLDPGSGRTLTLSWALLPSHQCDDLMELWREARASVTVIDPQAWETLRATLHQWIHPEMVAKRQAGAETVVRMQRFASQLLRDLVSLARGRPGLAAGFRRFAQQVGCELDLPRDEIFELLYPDLDSLQAPYGETLAQRQEPIRVLAAEWSRQPCSVVASRLAGYESEAKANPSTNLTGSLAKEMARTVAKPEEWFEAFLAAGLADLAARFTEEIATMRRQGWA